MNIWKITYFKRKRPFYSNFIAKTLPFFFLTPLRAGVILITPLFIWLVKKIATIKLNKATSLLIFLLLFSALYGELNETNELANALLALFIEIPIVYLFFAEHIKIDNYNYSFFIRSCTWILLIIDLLGFYTFFYYNIRGEDSFGIPYGQHFTSVHGLSLLNAIMFIYYIFNNLFKKTWINKLFATFFFISFVMCFYGLGLLCLGAVLGVYSLTYFNLKKIIGFTLVIGIAGYLVFNTNRNNLAYVEKKIDDTYNYDVLYEAPRKIQFAAKAYDRFCTSPVTDNLFGFGPGSYNGRIAFLLNIDANNPFTDLFGRHMPVYHQSDVWTFWSKTWVSINKYNDGTINKPNSSLVSIIMENGVLFAFLFLFLWVRMMFVLFTKRENSMYTSLFLIHAFMFLNFVTEQWLETSEFLFFVIFSGVNMALLNSNRIEIKSITKNE